MQHIESMMIYMFRCFHHPMIFRNEPLFYRKIIKSVDVTMIRVTKMEKDGFFSLHMATGGSADQLEGEGGYVSSP